MLLLGMYFPFMPFPLPSLPLSLPSLPPHTLTWQAHREVGGGGGWGVGTGDTSPGPHEAFITIFFYLSWLHLHAVSLSWHCLDSMSERLGSNAFTVSVDKHYMSTTRVNTSNQSMIH